VTEVKRPQAKKTKYVGLLKDGQTFEFDLLMLATPIEAEHYRFTASVTLPAQLPRKSALGTWNIGGRSQM